ncbi:D-Ala-D-Ala carboxypeptidase VanY [Clostridia bacterium]|nr:D-Ala-D-Ala carboxypeptidase VanY [Clostridia bacterium]
MSVSKVRRIFTLTIMLAIIIIIGAARAATTFGLPHELMDDEYLRLVNTDFLIDESERLTDLIKLTVRTKNDTEMRLRRVAANALKDLVAAAEADGVRLYVTSAYREYAQQRALYYNNLKDVGFDDHSTQLPGASEHQTGLAADVISREWLGYTLTPDFATTPEAQWLEAHCADYGFIIRYPRAKEAVTGIIYEPWHIRYVGTMAAHYLMDNGLTLEELWFQWYLYLEDHGL